MAVNEFELFHGIVLTKLMRSERPVALRLIETRPAEAWSAYRVNDELDLFIKHSTAPRLLSRGRGGRSWTFVFSPAQLRQMQGSRREGPVWAALVGGSRDVKDQMIVCLLDPDQIAEVVDLGSPNQQSLTVRQIPRSNLRVFKDKRERFLVAQSRLDQWEVPGG